MRGSSAIVSRWLAPGLLALAALVTAPRARACGACAVPELWDVQNLGGELVVVTNFGLLAEHADGWRVTCEELWGGLLLAAEGNSSEGWVSTDIGQFRQSGSLCDWAPGAPPEHASWVWKFALAAPAADGVPTRFVLVIDRDTQELHVERARGDEAYRVVHSFESTSGFRDLKAGGDPASVFVAGFGAGSERLWQVALSLDSGDHWETVVPDLPPDTNWLLRFVDPLFPHAVFVESEQVSTHEAGVWHLDAETGAMTELLALTEGEAFAGLTLLGDTLWLAGRSESGGSLYRADRRELTFRRAVSEAPAFGCLAAYAGALYACVNDFSYTSSFLLGRSSDEGRSWQPRLTVDELSRIEGCSSACGRTLDWLSAAFAPAANAGGAPNLPSTGGGEAGAPHPGAPSAPSGCSCRLGAQPAPGGSMLLAGLCVVGLAYCRTRRRCKLALCAGGLAIAACADGPEREPAAADCAGRGDDLTTLRLTSGDLVLSVLETTPEPPQVGDNEWLVRLRDRANEPVTGLSTSLVVTPFMPDHGHGTPARVGVAETGAGEYRLAPVNTFMPGLWRIQLAVSRSDDPERFEFSVCVE